MPDRTTFVCGNVFMKDVTPEMFQWWFAWMPADPIRGRLWDPEEHLGMIVDESTLRRLTDPTLSVKERIYGNFSTRWRTTAPAMNPTGSATKS